MILSSGHQGNDPGLPSPVEEGQGEGETQRTGVVALMSRESNLTRL